jgi:proteasome lid subunit RPN8/RPN11
MNAPEPCEHLFLIDRDGVVIHRERGASAHELRDSRTRWEQIWSHRESIFEIAHSHPEGPLAFSAEDESTMEALTAALGFSLVFSVVAPTGMLRRIDGEDVHVGEEPPWAAELRRLSGMNL